MAFNFCRNVKIILDNERTRPFALSKLIFDNSKAKKNSCLTILKFFEKLTKYHNIQLNQLY